MAVSKRSRVIIGWAGLSASPHVFEIAAVVSIALGLYSFSLHHPWPIRTRPTPLAAKGGASCRFATDPA
jgi:hypothetical protein